MKKLLMVCCLLVSVVSLSKAQGGGQGRGPQMSAADRAKQMQTQLKLTDDQTAKITAIYTEQTAKRDSITKAGGDRQAMRPLMQAANEKVQKVLTDDQKAAWKKIMEERMKNRGGNGGGGGTPPPPPPSN
jgi:protein CpxP